jgi:hypothetical protein
MRVWSETLHSRMTRSAISGVDLRLRVTRDEDGRLSGSACNADGSQVRTFSGTLELMRAFEELVPIERSAGQPAGEEKSIEK